MRSSWKLWNNAVAASLLATAMVAAPACDGGSRGGGAAAAPESGRYSVMRVRELLLKLDSSTGETWIVPSNGDGGWYPLGSAPSDAGRPNHPGRYLVRTMPTPKAKPFAQQIARLLRTDGASGRAWIADAAFGGEWVEIPDQASGGGRGGSAGGAGQP